MALTYEPIATTTLTGAQATITFSSISSAYTDLIVILSGTASTATNTYLQLNGDSSALYSTTRLYGNGTSATSARYSSQTFAYTGDMGTTQGTVITQIMNYANTNVNKTFLTRDNSTVTGLGAWVGLYRSTSAVSSVLVGAASGATFSTGTIATLYGIKAA